MVCSRVNDQACSGSPVSDQSGIYILRLIVVGFALVGIPFAPFVFFDHVPESMRWLFLLWIPVGLILWAMLSRRLLVLSRYSCPACKKRTMAVEVVEEGETGHVYFVCSACGLREKSDDVQLGS